MRIKRRVPLWGFLGLVAIVSVLLALFRPALLSLIGRPPIDARQAVLIAAHALSIEMARSYPDPVKVQSANVLAPGTRRTPDGQESSQAAKNWIVELQYSVGTKAKGTGRVTVMPDGSDFSIGTATTRIR